MKKLIIVSTKAITGQGGISTALQGYMNGLKKQSIEFELVESHAQGKNTLVNWIKCFICIACLAVKYRSNAVFWFHAGPWLSTIRKASIAIIPRLFGCDTVVHIHSPTFNTYLNKNSLSKFLIKLSLLPYKKIIVLTPWWKELLKTNGVSKTLIVSPNPNNQRYCDIALEYLTTPKIINTTNNINILSMSRLVNGKGIELVIEAMTKLPKTFHLTVAGDGPNAAELKALVKSFDLEKRVTFMGWINGKQKEQLLSSADLFCLPSTYDSFGMVFIEAMAFELPVVAYGWGPIADVVTSDVGECCQSAKVEDVVLAIENVYKNLPSYQQQGPKKVLDNYTPEIVTQNIIELLK